MSEAAECPAACESPTGRGVAVVYGKGRRKHTVYEFEGMVGREILGFVDDHVRSLLTWDIVVFFHRNQDSRLDIASLAARLGRSADELRPEIEALCRDHILADDGGIIMYRPEPPMRRIIGDFAEACESRVRRLAFIALVLRKTNPRGV